MTRRSSTERLLACVRASSVRAAACACVAACACAAATTTACLTTSAGGDASRAPGAVPIHVREVMGGPRGTECGLLVDVDKGAVPEGAHVIAVLEMTSPKPQALAAFEKLAKTAALARCGDGARVRQAVEERGGIVAATVAVYVLGDVVDGGVAAVVDAGEDGF